MQAVSGKRISGNACIIQLDSTRKVHGNSDEVKWQRLKGSFKRIFKARRIVTVAVNITHKLTPVRGILMDVKFLLKKMYEMQYIVTNCY